MILEKCKESLKNSGWDDAKYSVDNGISLDIYIKKTPLNYYEATRLAMCLGIQLSMIHSFNKSLLYVTLENIIRINEDWFLITKAPSLVSILDDDTITIEEPIANNVKYIAPELRNIISLPHKTNISCIYYSIALLIKHAMNITDPLSISSIANSPLYYFLERCMIKEPALRHFLFI